MYGPKEMVKGNPKWCQRRIIRDSNFEEHGVEERIETKMALTTHPHTHVLEIYEPVLEIRRNSILVPLYDSFLRHSFIREPLLTSRRRRNGRIRPKPPLHRLVLGKFGSRREHAPHKILITRQSTGCS